MAEPIPDIRRRPGFISTPEGEYRRLQAMVFRYARAYDGTETSYQDFMAACELWEEAINAHQPTGSPTLRETAAAVSLNPHNPKDINKALAVAAANLERVLHEADGPLYRETFDGIFLSTHKTRFREGGAESGRRFEFHHDEIVSECIKLLAEHQVFTDDIIVTTSKRPTPEMVRQENYIKIEIPRIAKTVLLCNEIGETTFVINGYISNELLAELSKTTLLQHSSIQARAVKRSSFWKRDMTELLFTNNAWEAGANAVHLAKMDVRHLSEARQHLIHQMRQRYTAESFVAMKSADAKRESMVGKRFYEIGAIFGITGDVVMELPRLELAAIIWPEHEDIRRLLLIERRQPDDWRRRIEEEGHSPESWVQLTSINSRAVNVDGRGIAALARIFGVTGDPRVSRQIRLTIGAKIWPDSVIIQQALAARQI